LTYVVTDDHRERSRMRCSIGDFMAATRVDHLVVDAPDQGRSNR
jgi:hypothetical protein